MKKIIYGWLVFLTLPLTVIGYSEIVKVIEPEMFIQVLLGFFSIGVMGFQFIMTAALIIQGWKEQGLNSPFGED